ncbi:MAG: hypothetical protein V2J10_11260, partial [Wenzhouxiangella sp.]|nr:hypothetical protein [Wenzhouxiangella sp.]
IETLLGLEIVDESDTTDDLRRAARDRWIKRARKLGIELPEESNLQTLSEAAQAAAERRSSEESQPETQKPGPPR